MSDWTPDSWKRFPVRQQAEYEDPEHLQRVLGRLSRLPPIVTSWEVEKLRSQLAEAARGERFVLQGGDCSERFSDCRASLVDAKLKVLLMMSAVLVWGGGKQVVRVGRIAGQYAKPRSSNTETRDGVTLPSYRGDIVNGLDFDAESRRPDPQRLIEGYSNAALTINFIRSLLSGGFGDMHHPEVWDLSFVEHAAHPQEYLDIIEAMKSSVQFLDAMVGRPLSELAHVDFFTSHEGLHLPFEQACSEQPPLRDAWYDLSCHFPWIGDRTRAIDGAHVEFFRGIRNPLGVKVGPTMKVDELLELIRVLDPDDEPGRLTLICRFGADKVSDMLPPLVEAVQAEGRTVTWTSDPMHGNTFKAGNGMKTRHFDAILAELERSFEVHEALDSVLGGVHFEMTGQDVTEVVGGARGLTEDDLARAYDSSVDPRLNYEQSLELAFLIARRMGGLRG